MIVIHSSSRAQALLGQLQDSHRLYMLAQNPQGEARAELARIMSDLLSIELSISEHELIADVLMDLLRQAEMDLRRAVAERLAVMENIPLRMVLALANDEIDVADPILRRSRILTDMDLIYIVKAQGAAHARAVATRPNISDDLIDVLVEEKDLPTAIHLSENKSITLTDNALHLFAEMARDSERLARPLIIRPEISEEFAMKLYDFVSEEIQTYIESNFDEVSSIIAKEEIEEALEDLSLSLQEEYIPTPQMIVQAEEMMRLEELTVDTLVERLRLGKIAEFIAMFSVYCALPVPTVVDILKQDNGQGLAVICKALKIQKTNFVNLYLMTARLRRKEIITQSLLAKALSYYDTIKPSDARIILNQSRH